MSETADGEDQTLDTEFEESFRPSGAQCALLAMAAFYGWRMAVKRGEAPDWDEQQRRLAEEAVRR